MSIYLNQRAERLLNSILGDPEVARISIKEIEGGGRFVDCGIQSVGGLKAGVLMAKICLADLADVSIESGDVAGRPCPTVRIATDHPVLACLGSQYAGWKLSSGKFFAMGSGPMRSARLEQESIFERVAYQERPAKVIGVLETRSIPPQAIYEEVAKGCGVAPSDVTFLVAPTASLAGGLQIVARSVETALHKLAELKFDLDRIVSAFGTAPLPPVAQDDFSAIGRTNDAILYGARVILNITGDEDLSEIGPRVPSSGSKDFGEPFAAIFKRSGNDFYGIDPLLFSPAEVIFQNIETGRVQSFGKVMPDILARSFYGD